MRPSLRELKRLITAVLFMVTLDRCAKEVQRRSSGETEYRDARIEKRNYRPLLGMSFLLLSAPKVSRTLLSVLTQH